MAQEREFYLPNAGLTLEEVAQALKQNLPQYSFSLRAEDLNIEKSLFVGVKVSLTDENTLKIETHIPSKAGLFWWGNAIFIPGAKLLEEVSRTLEAKFQLNADVAKKASSWRRWLESRSWAKIYALIVAPLALSAFFFYRIWGEGMVLPSRQGNIFLGLGLICFSMPFFAAVCLFGELLETWFSGDLPAPFIYNVLFTCWLLSVVVGIVAVYIGLGNGE
jgi:hypothetical protein